MSQRLNRGFNAPRFAVEAGEPNAIDPERRRVCSDRGLPRDCSRRFCAYSSVPSSLLKSRAPGVAQPATKPVISARHPEEPLPNVRRADARSRQIGGPDGISQVLQVSAYSGEPFASILARNLLSKDRWRAADFDESVPSGPEVPLIGVSLVQTSARKRLTGT